MSINSVIYPFDPDGTSEDNLVREYHTLTSTGMFDYFYIIPRAAPFFTRSVKIRLYPGGTPLEEGVHYNFGFPFKDASHTIGLPVYGAISFYDRTLSGQIQVEYQTLGDIWTLDEQTIIEILQNELRNPRITTWETIVELPERFPVINHSFDIEDFVGMSEAVEVLDRIAAAIEEAGAGGLAAHIADKNNPHDVTKIQVGLGLVDNYASSSVGEAQMGAANNRFMTPLRVRQAIEAIMLPLLNAHLADVNNPHNTTKEQVGLGLVQNLGIASQVQSEAGAVNNVYMTPLRVAQAISYMIGNTLTSHMANKNNPHDVTKAQVELGNVENFGIASPQEAQAGIVNNVYMTPVRVAQAIEALALVPLETHLNDANNPHNTNKTQVGLGSVENFGIASEAQARDATANNVYMTPLRVRQAIDQLAGAGAVEHFTNFDNPHLVTAAQVGAPTIQQMATALAEKLDTTGTAANSARAYGYDVDQFVTWLQTLTSGNATLFSNRSFQQALEEIRNGKVADSTLFDGHTYNQLVHEISSSVEGSSIQYVIPEIGPVDDDLGNEVLPPPSWALFGTIPLPDEDPNIDVTLMLSGGRNDESGGDHYHSTSILSISGALTLDSGTQTQMIRIRGAELRELNKSETQIQCCYRVVGSDLTAAVELWIYTEEARNKVVVTELSYKRFMPATMEVPLDLDDLITVKPTGLVDFPIAASGAEDLEAFIARRDNPHEVTKTQVGLGSVENYRIATQQEAETGGLNNVYMTPRRVAQAIVTLGGVQLAQHTNNSNNPHNVTKAQVGLDQVANYGPATDLEAEAGTATNKVVSPKQLKDATDRLYDALGDMFEDAASQL